jgi:hypothetical protein
VTAKAGYPYGDRHGSQLVWGTALNSRHNRRSRHYVKAMMNPWLAQRIEFAPRRTHLIEKRGVRRGVVPAHVTCHSSSGKRREDNATTNKDRIDRCRRF